MKSAGSYRHLAATTRRIAKGSTAPHPTAELVGQAQEYDDKAYRIDCEYLATAEMAHADTDT
jgi:hypothetical protein